MCSDKVIEFGARVLGADEVACKRVLEVGSRVVQDPSMTLRHHIESLGPDLYLGSDMESGVGVDVICRAEELVRSYGSPEGFDVVVSTELLEHVRDWRAAVSNMKQILKTGGVLLVTTRSLGFPYHGWPSDHWRYELNDMERIFCDMKIEELEPDPKEPGVFLRARKPDGFVEADLEGVRLYSMVAGRRVRRVPWVRERAFVTVMGARKAYQRAVPERFRLRFNALVGR